MRPILFLAGSLVLNGLLLGAVIWNQRLERLASHPAATLETVPVGGFSDNPVESEAAPGESQMKESFHWSQLDTVDWFAYRDGLVGIGCPTRTVRDILQPLIRRHYGTLARAQIRPYAEHFWERLRPPFKTALNELETSLAVLKAEQEQLLKRLFENLPTPAEEGGPSEAWTDFQLGFLPEDRRTAVKDCLNAHAVRSKEAARTQFRDLQERKDTYRRLQTQMESELTSLLSEDELEEFKLRNSPHRQLRDLRGIDLTETELREIIRMSENLKALADAGEEATSAKEHAALESLLGTDRVAALQRAKDPQFQQLLVLTERLDADPEQAAELWSLQEAMEGRVRQIAQDGSRSEADRQTQLDNLRNDLARQVESLLGGSRGRKTWEVTKRRWLLEQFRVPDIDPVLALNPP